ncbi:MAG: glycerol-3-phosphate dehydrogenase/oxidase [Candidatus Dormiibacterota bacterium]
MRDVARPFTTDGRLGNLADLGAAPVDVLVIGGGITGAGVALESVRRGYSVGLVEARDFAAGTSSRSSKLVHGGFRYLAQGEVGLVREALQERKALRKLYPDLVHPLPFLLPVPRHRREALVLKTGLILYDLLAADGGFPRHRRIGLAAAHELAPALHRSDIRGAWHFYDGQTDDTRLTLRVLRQAAEAGARVANYAAVTSAARKGEEWLVDVDDRSTGARLQARARYLVNATGVWAEELEGLSGRPPRFHMAPSKGVHLSLAAADLPIEVALVFPTGDGRVLFAVPWHGYVIVGTTDNEYHGDVVSPDCTPEEEADVLRAVNRFFGLSLGHDSVRSRWAGVRPLVSTGKARATKDLSRKPWIDIDDRGLVTITGGKLTTFRRMAMDAVDLLPRRRVPVAETGAALADAVARPAIAAGELLPGDAGYTLADVARACDEEMALELEDALSRRLRLSFVDAAAAWQAAPAAARVMAQKLGWTAVEPHLEKFREHLQREFGMATEELHLAVTGS